MIRKACLLLTALLIFTACEKVSPVESSADEAPSVAISTPSTDSVNAPTTVTAAETPAEDPAPTETSTTEETIVVAATEIECLEVNGYCEALVKAYEDTVPVEIKNLLIEQGVRLSSDGSPRNCALRAQEGRACPWGTYDDYGVTAEGVVDGSMARIMYISQPGYDSGHLEALVVHEAAHAVHYRSSCVESITGLSPYAVGTPMELFADRMVQYVMGGGFQFYRGGGALTEAETLEIENILDCIS